MKGRVLLLVDLSFNVYRAAAAHPLLTCDGTFTGGLYGFFQSFAKAVRDTGATDVAICQDRKPYLRSIAYPEYKLLRKKSEDTELRDKYQESMPMVITALEAIGLDPWGIAGFEADDMGASAVKRYRHRFEWIWGATNDSDVWQLFDVPNFKTFNKDVTDAWDGARLLKQLGLTPEQHMMSTALMGTHNDIAGIDKVGKVRSQAAAKDPALLRTMREKHGDLIERNLGLIKLPHPQFPGATLPQVREASSRDLYRALGRWDIQATDSMVKAVEQIQRGYR